MNKLALRHAWEALHRARNAHNKLATAQTIHIAEEAWSEFLSAAAKIYSKLEAGSKGSPKAEPWFGRMKNERKTDPLLIYVHHARNTDEHGVSEISVRKLEGVKVEAPAGGRMYGLQVLDDGEVIHHPQNTGLTVFTVVSMTLAEVHDDKHGDSFPVPTAHLGKDLSDQTPPTLSALALEYLDRLVRNGSEFAK